MQLASKLAELRAGLFHGRLGRESRAPGRHDRNRSTLPTGRLAPGGPGTSKRGLHLPGQPTPATSDAGGQDPLAAIRAVNALASADGSALLLLQNFHRFSSVARNRPDF